ncbi:MAG: hypothetical protein Q8859_03440 [Bacteroidota bacterium]|nr:hypothetical protein [Bacteroidota bacterium]
MKQLLSLFPFLCLFIFTEGQSKLPRYDKNTQGITSDWMVMPVKQKAGLFEDKKGNIVLSNGLISRTFSLKPDAATIGFDNLMNNEGLLRSVRPEGIITINGNTFKLGGLTGQKIHNYLLTEWLDEMEIDSMSLHYTGYETRPIKPRFPWKKRQEWISSDCQWPCPGTELILNFSANNETIKHLLSSALSDDKREILVEDKFLKADSDWKLNASKTHTRNSFINEGKFGEIMALPNNSVFAERKVSPNLKVVICKVNPGTDRSASWGPGIALLAGNRSIKLNIQPGRESFGFFDGENETIVKGLQADKSVYLKIQLLEDHIETSYSYDKKGWTLVGKITLNSPFTPKILRVGKTDRNGNNSDNDPKGELGRCFIEELSLLGGLRQEAMQSKELDYLKDIQIKVHYELYDGIPVICKWISVENKSSKEIVINNFKSEILALTEPESSVDSKKSWLLPNITVETDYRFGGMSNENAMESSVAWNSDPLYATQVNYERTMPCLLECYPKIGPQMEVAPGSKFETFRTWEIVHDSYDRERKSLAIRKMYRALAPWTLENPVLMHVRNADNNSVKTAIDQCAQVGFEMVIMTFGSGFNIEDTSPDNLKRMKELADYAHSKGIALGGYSLLASRSIDKDNDVVMPQGQTPRFGNSPCLESNWGQEYFSKLYNFYKETGMDILEHDGSYPGDVCASTTHPGHKGLEDSQWKQYQEISKFYQWCRGKGIFLNVPDCYFMAGSNKSGMGYRETNWSLPREQQEIIERQNIFDGTWEKTPSMGWMFVPLVEYQGGGAAATIEPLKEHLPHYGQRLANLFGAGVQACYRGPKLYDAPETEELVRYWTGFYKKHRRILDADIIHVRRPDGKDYDAILHVDPSGEEKGLLMIYNPLNEPIEREIRVSLYYTGLQDIVNVSEKDGKPVKLKCNRDYSINLKISIPAHSQTWYVFK